MKKIIIFMLTAILFTVMLAGCSGAPATDPADVKGETFDGGNISALVPDGWMGFHGTDYFDEHEEGYDPNVIQIVKGAKSEWDLLTKPYIMIGYYDADNAMMTPTKDIYDESVDLEPVTIGNYTWNGFTGKSIGTPIAVLWTGEEGEDQIQLTICLENGDKISLEDADVQAIIASVTPSK